MQLVLAQLDPTDCAMLALVGTPWLAVVVANNLSRAGRDAALPLKLSEFVGSVARLAWAKDNGCPWEEETCEMIAEGGQLDVLQWARKQGYPWDSDSCARAAGNGHLQMLRWLLHNGCPWDSRVCAWAAEGGHLEVL
jgi:hypothetical protein